MNPDLTYLYNITKLATDEINDIKKSFIKTLDVNEKQRKIIKIKKTKKNFSKKSKNKTKKLR